MSFLIQRGAPPSKKQECMTKDKGMKDLKVFEWELVAVLTKEEYAAFNKNTACKNALNALVKEMVQHWEMRDVEISSLFIAAAKKYDPDNYSEHDPLYEYQINYGKIYRRRKEAGKIKDLIDNIESANQIKAAAMELFGLKDK